MSERALWRAVILQAITDACSKGCVKSGHERASLALSRENAINWLKGNSWGFRYVCNLADVEPTRVLEAYKQIKEGRKVSSMHHRKKIDGNRDVSDWLL